jgi:DNA transposition AAA+ family ATPase
MPLYFFDISGGGPAMDAVGEELPDDEAAWQEAVRTARDVEWTLNPERSPHSVLEVKRDRRMLFRIEVSAPKISF